MPGWTKADYDKFYAFDGEPWGRPHYRDVICAEGRRIVEDRFALDFERWGYKW